MDFTRAKHYATSTSSSSEAKIMVYDPDKKARHSPEQIKYLEEYYHTDPKPDVHARSKISETIKLSPRAVQVWFQNRRAKSKHRRRRSDLELNEMREDYIPNRGDVIPISNLLNDNIRYSNSNQLVMSSSPENLTRNIAYIANDISFFTNYPTTNQLQSNTSSSSEKRSSLSLDNLLS